MNGFELSACDGAWIGGVVAGASGSNLYGLKFTGSSDFHVTDAKFSGWTTAGIRNEGSIVTTGRNSGCTFSGNSSAQWFGDYAPRVSAHLNGTDQTGVVSGAFTKVLFTTERYDLTGAYASSTFTPKTIGTYQVDAQVNFTTTLDQDVLLLSIYLNGAAYKTANIPTSGTGQCAIRISAQVDTSATTDTIEIYARQTSGGTKTISGATTETWFMSSLIGRTT